MPSLDDLGTKQVISGTPASDDIVAFYDVSEFGNSPVKKSTVAGLVSSDIVQAAIEADPDGALTALTPTRILYIDDLTAAWFNGSNTELMGVIPLTSAQAVVGTKVRVRGFARVHFQGSAALAGGDATLAVVFNVAADAANQVEGVGIVVNSGETNRFDIDVELELKTAPSSKYKLGLGASTPTYLASVLRAGLTFERWGNTGDSTAFVVDPTITESVGSTAGLVVQLQVFGGSTNLSICNFWMDLNYEVITA